MSCWTRVGVSIIEMLAAFRDVKIAKLAILGMRGGGQGVIVNGPDSELFIIPDWRRT